MYRREAGEFGTKWAVLPRLHLNCVTAKSAEMGFNSRTRNPEISRFATATLASPRVRKDFELWSEIDTFALMAKTWQGWCTRVITTPMSALLQVSHTISFVHCAVGTLKNTETQYKTLQHFEFMYTGDVHCDYALSAHWNAQQHSTTHVCNWHIWRTTPPYLPLSNTLLILFSHPYASRYLHNIAQHSEKFYKKSVQMTYMTNYPPIHLSALHHFTNSWMTSVTNSCMTKHVCWWHIRRIIPLSTFPHNLLTLCRFPLCIALSTKKNQACMKSTYHMNHKLHVTNSKMTCLYVTTPKNTGASHKHTTDHNQYTYAP